MAREQKSKSAAPTRDELIVDIKQVMTMLAELKHEPHGGGRQARHHSHRLAELVSELHREIHSLSEGEQTEWQRDVDAVLAIHVDGAHGRTLGDYIAEGDIDSWGKDYCSYWENSDHHGAMQRELNACMELLRKSCCQPKKR